MRLAVNHPATVADREGISDGNLWGRPGQSRMNKINLCRYNNYINSNKEINHHNPHQVSPGWSVQRVSQALVVPLSARKP